MNSEAKFTAPRPLLDAQIPAAPALALAALPDGKHALTTGLDFHLRLWDLDQAGCIKSWNANGPLSSVVVNAAGEVALLGAVQGVVCWDIANWQLGPVTNLWSHSEITAVAWAETNGIVLAASEDTTIHRWNDATGERLDRLTGHRITPTDLALDQKGDLAISGDLYGELRLWDVASGSCLRTWQGHNTAIVTVALAPDGQQALSGDQEGTVRHWDLQQMQSTLISTGEWIHDMLFRPDQSLLYLGAGSGLSLWDLETCERTNHWQTPAMVALSLTPDQDRLLGLARNNHLLVWNRA